MGFRAHSRGFYAASAALGLLGLAVACGSNDDAMPIGDGGAAAADGGSGTADGSVIPPDDDSDGGIFMSHADAGCPVKYAGPNPGTVATSIARTGVAGGIAWESPGSALTTNGQYAKSVVTDGEQTELLRVTGYGFDLPANVTIKGVVVQVNRQGANEVVDGNIELWLDGAPSERPKFVASGWPTAIGTHHYGQEVDTWGNELTPELVGRAGFGTEIWARRREDAGTGPVAAEVESLLITIWYCE